MTFLNETITACGVTVPFRCYIPDVCGKASYAGRRPAVIIFPGGGYGITYSGEAEPIALKYAADGICAFILDYSCTPVHFPVQQLQAFKAIRYVRENAERFGIDPLNIATTGFSAGGHLCSTTGTLWNKMGEYFAAEGMDDVDCHVYRPDKLILCYPVIMSRGKFAHTGSIKNLLGPEQYQDESLIDFVSTDRQIDDETPPAFIWHTSEDGGVPPMNTYAFASGLAERGIHCEVHVYLRGGHGLCLGTCVTDDRDFFAPHEVSEWIYKAIRFAYADLKK